MLKKLLYPRFFIVQTRLQRRTKPLFGHTVGIDGYQVLLAKIRLAEHLRSD
jgi:hypothetical protein